MGYLKWGHKVSRNQYIVYVSSFTSRVLGLLNLGVQYHRIETLSTLRVMIRKWVQAHQILHYNPILTTFKMSSDVHSLKFFIKDWWNYQNFHITCIQLYINEIIRGIAPASFNGGVCELQTICLTQYFKFAFFWCAPLHCKLPL